MCGFQAEWASVTGGQEGTAGRILIPGFSAKVGDSVVKAFISFGVFVNPQLSDLLNNCWVFF